MDHGQAQAATYVNHLNATVPRDAGLREKADEGAKYIQQAHELLDSLEDALLGSRPRPTDEVGAPHQAGLQPTLNRNCAQAATLVGRLQTLLGSL